MFFYYPSEEYISYLMTVDELTFLDEIDCRDLFAGKDPRERILIFALPGQGTVSRDKGCNPQRSLHAA